jgi:hypothetical protein
MRRITLGLALAALATTTVLADYEVTGRFMYLDREFDPTGFTGVEPQLPIRFADVQVVDGSKIVGSGVTDANGNFVFTVQDSRVRDIYVRCLARRQTATSTPIDVRSGNQVGTIWSVRTLTLENHQPDQNVFIGTLVAVPGAGGEAFNLYDAGLSGVQYLETFTGPGPGPLLLIIFHASNPNLSSYSNNRIVQGNNAGYDDTVLLHEMGHYVVDNYSASDSPGGTHRLSNCSQNIMRDFDEGHASFWGLSVRRHFNLPHSSTYVRTTGQPGPGNLQFFFDSETQLPFVCSGATSETSVYTALWDILDGPGASDESPGVDEPFDLLEGLDAEYWSVMTTYLPTATNISLEDFWDGWFHPSLAHGRHPEMKAIFQEVEVEYFTDPFEPNETVAEATAVSAGPTLYHLTFFADPDMDLLGEADVDVVSFQAVAGATYTIETLNLLGDANTSIELLDSDGSTVLASSDDRSLFDPSSLVIHTADASETLYVRSFHAEDLGIYGSYDLRIGTAGSGVDNDMDGHPAETDCDDNDPDIHPDAVEVCNGVDDNCDLQIDEGFDADGDGWTGCNGDCNDANATINPDAVEVCDSIDNNCDSVIDDGFDLDGDGFTSCGGDCNDADPAVHPNQPELCNGIDDNCNGLVDEETDGDGDGVTACDGDCDDGNPDVFPGQIESCNGIDDDCNDLIDEGFPDTDGDGILDCFDTDDDDDGVPDTLDCAPLVYWMNQLPGQVSNTTVFSATTFGKVVWSPIEQAQVYNVYRGEVVLAAGWSYDSLCMIAEFTETSLEDADVPPVGSVYYYVQAATNACGEGAMLPASDGQPRPVAGPCQPQGMDSDLDLVQDLTDNCPVVFNTTQADLDREGRGDICDNCPDVPNPDQSDLDGDGTGDVCQDDDGDGFTADVDCDDDEPTIFPGATEICNGIDDNCDTVIDEGFDVDADGFTTCGGDCNDGDAAVNPGATEGPPGDPTCSDSLDNDCNGAVDGLDPACQLPPCPDADSDGFADCTTDPSCDATGLTCGDCNDGDAAVNPGATEICNGIDDNCDTVIDEGFDMDADGFTTCGGDCEDTIPTVHPGAIEVFNGLDDDCNDFIDDVVEILEITLATYQISSSKLTVEATTNYPVGSVTLTVEGYGTMEWIAPKEVYRLIVQPTGPPPGGTVTVVSTAGGSATSPVTDF